LNAGEFYREQNKVNYPSMGVQVYIDRRRKDMKMRTRSVEHLLLQYTASQGCADFT